MYSPLLAERVTVEGIEGQQQSQNQQQGRGP